MIAWTITDGAPQLLARCQGYPQTRRQDDFQAWKTALTALAGPPDHANERALPERGAVHAYAIWERHDGVRIKPGRRMGQHHRPWRRHAPEG